MDVVPDQAEGRGVVLRRWRVEDAPVLHDVIAANAEHLRPRMAWVAREPLTVVDRIGLIEGWEQERLRGGDAIYGIWKDGEIVGGCGLHRRIEPGGLEIGYWVHVDHQGRGMATAASRVLTDLAFTMSDIDRVEIHHDLENTASEAVPVKLGFEFVATMAASSRDLAPADTGTDKVWRTTREAWLGRS